MWQHPLQSGADLVLYSATKYIGGHSDVIAGAVLGKKDLMARIKTLRTFLGNMAGPWTGWLLMRSLETLKIRMEKQQENAIHIAQKLRCHPLIEKVHYLDDFDNPIQKKIFSKQCLGSGAMISFDIKGSESEAFQFLNNLKLFKLAVSLGGTESLAQHPYTMTHAGVDDELKVRHGVTPSLVRLSIGIEKMEDIWWDIEQALNQVDISQSVLLVEAKAELVH
jgi:methionine-gamma-lyase